MLSGSTANRAAAAARRTRSRSDHEPRRRRRPHVAAAVRGRPDRGHRGRRGLVAWAGFRELDSLLLLYGPLSAAVLVGAAGAAPRADHVGRRLHRHARVRAALRGLAQPVLSAVAHEPGAARDGAADPARLWLGLGAAVTYFAVAVIGGPVPGRLQLESNETLAIHVSLPFMLVVALAYAAEALRRLTAERSARERLAIEAERKRIAFELHDSAKQRLHAAHLLVTRCRAACRSTWTGRSRAPRSSWSRPPRTWTRASPSCARRSRAGGSTRPCAPAPTELDRPTARGSRSAATRPTSRRSSARTPTGSPRGAQQRAPPRGRDRDRRHVQPRARHAAGAGPRRRPRPARAGAPRRHGADRDGEPRGHDRRAAHVHHLEAPEP